MSSNRSSSSRDGGKSKRKKEKPKNDTKKETAAPNLDEELCDPFWNMEYAVPFQKNFYQERPSVSGKSAKEVTAFYTSNKITIQGNNSLKPISFFYEAGLPRKILETIHDNGWTQPSPIQAQVLPMALSGRDVVGIAQTGSGKISTFILPALVHIAAQKPLKTGDGPICLVVVPTCELAQQVDQMVTELARPMDMNTCCIHGGDPNHEGALRDIERGAEICIATPGHLFGFLVEKKINLERTTFLVLDEADRMLDMGLQPKVRKIVKQIRPDRQVLIWSATWPKAVQSLAQDFLCDYIQVNIGTQQLTVNKKIRQVVEVCNEHKKEALLRDYLKHVVKDRLVKTIIFVNNPQKGAKLAKMLNNSDWQTLCILCDKFQEETLTNFKIGPAPILLATDVLARGFDMDNIKFVINFDYPENTDVYIHRIGHTGRAGQSGNAITYFTKEDAKHADQLMKVLRNAKQIINPFLASLGTDETYAEGETDVKCKQKLSTNSNKASIGTDKTHADRQTDAKSKPNKSTHQNKVSIRTDKTHAEGQTDAKHKPKKSTRRKHVSSLTAGRQIDGTAYYAEHQPPHPLYPNQASLGTSATYGNGQMYATHPPMQPFNPNQPLPGAIYGGGQMNAMYQPRQILDAYPDYGYGDGQMYGMHQPLQPFNPNQLSHGTGAIYGDGLMNASHQPRQHVYPYPGSVGAGARYGDGQQYGMHQPLQLFNPNQASLGTGARYDDGQMSGINEAMQNIHLNPGAWVPGAEGQTSYASGYTGWTTGQPQPGADL